MLRPPSLALLCCLVLPGCAQPPAPSSQATVPTSQAPPASSQATVPTSQFQPATVSIQTKNGAVKLNVEVADTEAKREYGLMNRTSLPSDGGMLFVFEPPADAKQIGFWMKDTLIPLSIAFVEPDMTIESLQEMEPQSQQLHIAPRDYAYAVEANKGFFVAHAVSVGDRVVVQR